jgi:nucleoside 2-deoxyribosyltransferase
VVADYSDREADLMIADVTGKNPNVYWEFGFAFALGRDYLVLSQNRRLPFDISKQR